MQQAGQVFELHQINANEAKAIPAVFAKSLTDPGSIN